ncbi:recombinase family protein [Paraburkholderia aromaticivorans]|uniref:recombinase family protein n=1 Tax=Paraburkholderia aromaticivorans TaxID=2026199 RepID=UPI001F0F4F41|nr:recombinase family protein [Paraburkholderia aromaticivorans]
MSPPRTPHAVPAAPARAAQYIRMSTDHQEYSPLFQREAIARYAAANNIRLVRDYEDSGISGLTLRERPALIQLLLDVEDPARRFSCVLVYDVSRWGRFQDVDESAFYEYACRRAGVRVIYVAEPFENDGSPLSSVMKAMKRAMAGEFSREMSRKVFLGHCLNVRRGFHTGGPVGYGLRRVLVNAGREVLQPLAIHEYKNVQTDRVIVVPDPSGEAAIIRKMFEWYATQPVTGAGIAQRLNDFGIVNGAGRSWQGRNIMQILRNEKYIGTNVYSRTTSKLDGPWQQLPQNEWIRVPDAFSPVVDRRLFATVQKRIEDSRRRPTREEITDGMRKVLSRNGRISQKLLKHYRRAPSAEQVAHEFGSLNEAYKAIGYVPNLDPERSENRFVERRVEQRVAHSAMDRLRELGHEVRYEKHTAVLCVDGALRIQLVVRRPWMIQAHLPYWTARWPDCFAIDFLVYGRIERAGTELLDFHVLPRGSLKAGEFTVVFRDGRSHFEPYRHDDLKALIALTDSVPLDVLSADPGCAAR